MARDAMQRERLVATHVRSETRRGRISETPSALVAQGKRIAWMEGSAEECSLSSLWSPADKLAGSLDVVRQCVREGDVSLARRMTIHHVRQVAKLYGDCEIVAATRGVIKSIPDAEPIKPTMDEDARLAKLALYLVRADVECEARLAEAKRNR